MEKDYHFNPRTPCGVRHLHHDTQRRTRRFQSTHPLRGATTLQGGALSLPNISIHAPLAGCDSPCNGVSLCCRAFQSTHPLRGATCTAYGRKCEYAFQSTHPLRGATSTPRHATQDTAISIHAPLAGCDGPQGVPGDVGRDFNPRTPCGVRRTGGFCSCAW